MKTRCIFISYMIRTLCMPNPCQNGGKCTVLDGGTNYICTYPVITTGRSCENVYPSAFLSGTTIPGQGYVYLEPPEIFASILPTLKVMVYNQAMTWPEFQKYANVTCRMAGYNGTFSPSLLGYYEDRKPKRYRSLLIRDCSGNEDSLFDCGSNSYTSWPFNYKFKVNCLPPDSRHVHGVWYDLWTDKLLSSHVSSWKLVPIFQIEPNASHILSSFDVMFRVATNLCIKLSAYLMVRRPGLYSISAACKDGCEVWWRRVEETGLDDNSQTSAVMIIKLKHTLLANKYEQSPKQAKSILIGCHLYYIEVYSSLSFQPGVEKFTNLAMLLPGDDQWSAPIPSEFLYWNRPGSRELHFILTKDISSVIRLGSQLSIQALYKFCCVGLACPSCPLTLYLHALNQKIIVNSSLQMNCVEYNFTRTIDVVQQPKNYSIQITYFLTGDQRWVKKRKIKSIQVSESTIYSCAMDNFQQADCLSKWRAYSALCNVTTVMEEDCLKACFCNGSYYLHSPLFPWKAVFSRIILCVSFLFHLPTYGLPRLDVYVNLKKGKQLIWSIHGFQGKSWRRGSFPVRAKEAFQVIFGFSSKLNGTACGIQDFRLSSSECDVFPTRAKLGHQCLDSQFQCNNGECIDKYHRCNGIKDDCIDGSDEIGCTCLINQFTCFDGSCVDVSSLCSGKPNCKNSEDEMRCEPEVCHFQQCMDGRCPSTSSPCHDAMYNISECWGLNNTCRNQETQCKEREGMCGFENGNCGIKSDIGWTFYSPTSKSPYKIYDHSFLEGGSYFMARPSKNQPAFSKLSIQWTETKPFCMQFWYVVSAKSNSSFQVCIEKINSTRRCLWGVSSTIDSNEEWSFGQIELPGNFQGKVVGVAKGYFVAVDDISFIETLCSKITHQTDPSCNFDGSERCHMTIDNKWVSTMYKHHKGESNFYLSLAMTNKVAKITSQVLSPKLDGWKCLKMWINSENNHFPRKLYISYKTEKGSISVFNYSSVTPGWVYFQSSIPREEKLLQVVIEGDRNAHASLSIDDITYSKYQCQDIPDVKSGNECLEYNTLESLDRRIDQKVYYDGTTSDDSPLSTTSWYRITGLAGNQIATECVTNSVYACYAHFQGWINGTMPTVSQGRVNRTMCFRNGKYDMCCPRNANVTVRNCGRYFVYRFPIQFRILTMAHVPGHPLRAGKVCTKHSFKNLTIGTEWQDWTSLSSSLEWKILGEVQYMSTSKSILADQDYDTSLHRSIGVQLHGSVQFTLPVQRNAQSLTLCFWISANNTLRKSLKIRILTVSEIFFDSHIGRALWTHICLSLQSGVYLTFVDGAVVKMVYGLLELQGAVNVSFTSYESRMHLKLTSLNVWNKFLDEHTILYMSYNCKNNRGNVVDWERFFESISTAFTSNTSVVYYNETSCKGREGNALSIISNTSTSSSAIATIISPQYQLPFAWVKSSSKCLSFRYRLWGPGARALKLYQVLDNKKLPWRPIWMAEGDNSGDWKDGRVTLSAVTAYQIAILGQVSNPASGLISIGALFTSEDQHCAVLPPSASKACDEVFTNSTGILLSPYYPGYYSNNANCNSTVKAKPGHAIRLDIVEFDLEMSSRCENDSMDVYDGAKRVGRFCGIRYPPIIQSTSNELSVIFRSNANITRQGFMMRYRILKDNDASKECLQDCPAECECRRLSDGRIVVSSFNLHAVPDRLPRAISVILFSGNTIFQVEQKTFSNLQQLSLIDLSYNRIIHMERKAFSKLPSLHTLKLNMNFIRTIENETWTELRSLKNLDLGDNLLTAIGNWTFSGLTELKVLSLRGNVIKLLEVDGFRDNTQLTSLYLHSNAIQEIPNGLFRKQRQLKVLQLHNNKLKTVTKLSFRGLAVLEKLTLHNNAIKESTVSRDAFSEMKNLRHLTLDSFILCCYAQNTIPTLSTCDSQANGFSSCEDMLKSTVIRIGIWVQGLFASFGNLAVILWWTILSRTKSSTLMRNKSKVQSLLLRNLALADFLMGIYLLFIAIQDAIWKGEYVDHDIEWRTGISCQVAGAISTLSSEVSVLMLVALTADRFSTIVFDFRGKRLNLKTAKFVCVLVWVFGSGIAFSPLIAQSYFHDESTGFSFYGRSTVCLPFQLSSDKPAGWEYSVSAFMAFNGAAFLFILVAYVAIFIKVRQSARNVQSAREPSSLGTRIMFIVMTDFCCWMPVIVLGIMSLVGLFHDPTGQVYALIAVFVLPVNSSINPVMYTFATPQAMKALHQLRTGIAKAMSESGIETKSSTLQRTRKRWVDTDEKQNDVQLNEVQ